MKRVLITLLVFALLAGNSFAATSDELLSLFPFSFGGIETLSVKESVDLHGAGRIGYSWTRPFRQIV